MTETSELVYKAMADTSRRQILAALCEAPREAGELARLVGLAPNAISFHLRALKSADLVNVQRDGRFLRYSVEKKNLQTWVEHVGQTFRPQWFEPHRNVPRGGSEASVAGVDTDTHDAPAVASWADSDQLPTELL